MGFRTAVAEGFKLTLEYHDKLNPLIWDDNEVYMRERVKTRLLQLGQMWADFANIPEDAIKDIVLTGGNANYNYTPYSDLDIHVIVDMAKFNLPKEFLDDYLYDKKLLWAIKHPNLTVMGYPVEMYAEDSRDKLSTDNAFYSLDNDRWIVKPVYKKDLKLDTAAVRRKLEEYSTMIEAILTTPGDHDEEIRLMKEKLYQARSSSIHTGGAFSTENLVYKELRNNGYLDRLNKYLIQHHDETLSLY